MGRILKIANKIENQWKQEKVVKRKKQIRINELEQWIIVLGLDPNDANFLQALIKSKNIEIQVLKKKLKMLYFDHVQALKLQEMQREND